MTKPFRVEVTGGFPTDFEERLTGRVLDEVSRVLAEAGNDIMTESKRLVPVRNDILRASADKVGVNVNRGDNRVEVTFGYGGPAADYAVLQHEIPSPPPYGESGRGTGTDGNPPTYMHDNGEWKFLERPVLEAEQRIRDDVTRAAERALGEGSL